MKLSDLSARYGPDTEVMIEDEYGIPRPVAGVDIGVMSGPDGHVGYLLLTADHDADDN